MRLFIDLWADPLVIEKTPSWPLREQDALVHFLIHHPVLRERAGFVKQRLINAYAVGPSEWVEGELLVHFAGCWVDSKCAEYFTTFWDKRKTLL